MKKRTALPILQSLLDLIEEGYSRKAWHGPNLRGSIRGLTAQEAAWRPGPKRHNIWEIVVHCAYWKYTVRRRILGEKRGSFPLKGSNWFPRTGAPSEKTWRADIKLLEDAHRKMIEAIRSLTVRDLRKIPAGSTLRHEATLRGIASHDVYHAGQIQLLKRLMR